MKILITGGAGYIGSHCAKRMAAAGHDVFVVDSLVRGHAAAVRWGPLFPFDLRDETRLAELLRNQAIEAVVHFAAFAYVGESCADPLLYFHNNVGATLSLLRVMAGQRVPYLVFSSTCAVYGTPRRIPVAEDEPLHPINPYGESKLMVETALGWLARNGGAGARMAAQDADSLRWVTLRYFNAAGDDPDGEIGEEHCPETHLIPRIMGAALGRIPALEVFGDDFPTADGTCIRDYVHVNDLADAHLLALDHLRRGGESCALNLGTGAGHSVRELIAATEAVSGRKVPVRFVGRRAGDPPVLVADSSRAQAVLGWRPRMSALGQILETAWNWHGRLGRGLDGL